MLLRIGNLVLDPNSVKVYLGDIQISLTIKEFGILEYLMRNIGRVVSQEELLEHVWNDSANGFTQTIKVHIKNIRRKLDAAGGTRLLGTKKGRGYFIEDNTTIGDESTN